ncbi:MAG TPA: HypC/HybG/HupF family hydrogenase formation chaperone [Gaiellales bacterium]
MSAGSDFRDVPACVDEHCITCSDEGLPLRIVALEGDGLARCLADGSPCEPGETVDVQLVGDVAPGDLVLVHAGVALALLEVADA